MSFRARRLTPAAAFPSLPGLPSSRRFPRSLPRMPRRGAGDSGCPAAVHGAGGTLPDGTGAPGGVDWGSRVGTLPVPGARPSENVHPQPARDGSVCPGGTLLVPCSEHPQQGRRERKKHCRLEKCLEWKPNAEYGSEGMILKR